MEEYKDVDVPKALYNKLAEAAKIKGLHENRKVEVGEIVHDLLELEKKFGFLKKKYKKLSK